jgi:hypothetical protein
VNIPLDESDRKEAFSMLVGLQDRGRNVEESRDEVAAYYGIGVSQLVSIEQEGIDKAWPPLGDRS